ncbi:hypothetical protein Tco_0685174 [Tanacetum coccineum]
MNQNRTVFYIDEETDTFYLQKAVEYHEWLIQQKAQPRLTRTPIFHDREDAERCLRADYFDDHSSRSASEKMSNVLSCSPRTLGTYSTTARAYEIHPTPNPAPQQSAPHPINVENDDAAPQSY